MKGIFEKNEAGVSRRSLEIRAWVWVASLILEAGVC